VVAVEDAAKVGRTERSPERAVDLIEHGMGTALVEKIRLSCEQRSTLVFAEIVLQRGLGSKSPNAGDVCLVIGAVTLRFCRPCRRHRDAPLLLGAITLLVRLLEPPERTNRRQNRQYSQPGRQQEAPAQPRCSQLLLDHPLLRLAPRHFLCLLSRLCLLRQPSCGLQVATLGILELALVLRAFQECAIDRR